MDKDLKEINRLEKIWVRKQKFYFYLNMILVIGGLSSIILALFYFYIPVFFPYALIGIVGGTIRSFFK